MTTTTKNSIEDIIAYEDIRWSKMTEAEYILDNFDSFGSKKKYVLKQETRYNPKTKLEEPVEMNFIDVITGARLNVGDEVIKVMCTDGKGNYAPGMMLNKTKLFYVKNLKAGKVLIAKYIQKFYENN